jgi:hypothetical protein
MPEFLRRAVRLHILHRADRGEVHGAWMATELAGHGYRISPGSLYPTLHKMEAEAPPIEPAGHRRPSAPFLCGDGQWAQGAGIDQAPAEGVGP